MLDSGNAWVLFLTSEFQTTATANGGSLLRQAMLLPFDNNMAPVAIHGHSTSCNIISELNHVICNYHQPNLDRPLTWQLIYSRRSTWLYLCIIGRRRVACSSWTLFATFPSHDCWLVASLLHRRRRLLVQLKLKNAPCISTADHWPAQLDGYWLDRQHRTSLHVCHGQQRGSSWRAGMARPPDLAIVVGASNAYIEMDFHASKSTRPATSWWCCEDEQSYPGGTCRHYGEREAGHRRFSFRPLCCM